MADWDLPGYTGLKALGSGGAGDVVLASHDASGTLVAIKYLRRKLLADPQWVELFRAEAQVLAALDDPNIVRLYEYAESPSGAAIVMELVDGVSVREILTHQGATTAEAALVVLRGSLRGLAAAHRRNVVHRDYKPENVLVNGNGDSKLTDFGIAARSGEEPVAAGSLMYAPPEQFDGRPASPAGDVYAATATFYECLTGRPPFTGDTAERLLYQHLAEPVPLDPVPEPLRPLVAAGMAKEPGNRPADAATFITALNAVASGAYGPDWAKRGRAHLGEAALLLAALWPSGAPPALHSSAVERVNLSRRSQNARESRHLLHLWHLRHIRHLQHLRHLQYLRRRRLSPVAATVAAAVAVTLLAAGTALAVGGHSSAKLSASIHPTTVQQVTLQPPGSSASNSSSGSSAPSVAARKHSSSSGPSSSGSSSASASPSSSAKASSSARASDSASAKASASASASSSSPPPAVTGISPASGSTGGGTAVTITGTGLAGATGVSFGGAAGTITADTATQITVTSPPGKAGTVNVTVVTPSGTSAVQFTYVVPAPALTGISPTSGSTGGGTVVTLTGTSLAGATGVSFGGAAGTITADTATQITVTSPPGKGTVNVTVTTASGTSNTEQFTYVLPIIQ